MWRRMGLELLHRTTSESSEGDHPYPRLQQKRGREPIEIPHF